MPTRIREKLYDHRIAFAEAGLNPCDCYGSGGGGSTNSTVTQTNVPDWLEEDVLQSVGAAEEIASQPYTPYTGPRLADLDPNQAQAYNSVNNTFGYMPYIGDSANMAGSVFGSAQNFLNYQPQQVGTGYQQQGYNPMQFSSNYGLGVFGANPINYLNAQSNYNPNQFDVSMVSPQSTYSQYAFNPEDAYSRLGDINGEYDPNTGFLLAPNVNTKIWNQAIADYYADPYAQAVTDITQREATRDSEIQQQKNYAEAEQAGAYGGSRQAIIEAERQRNLMQNLSDIENKGLEAAYLNAQQQFERDRAAKMQADISNQGAYLQGMTGYEGSRQFGGNFGLDALRLGDASNQFGANLEAQTANTYADYLLRSQLANQQANLTGQQTNASNLLDAAKFYEQMRQQGGQMDLQAMLANQGASLDASKTDAANMLQAQQLYDQARQFYANNWLQTQQAQEAANQYGAQFGEASAARLADYQMQAALANQQAMLAGQQLGVSALAPMMSASQQMSGLGGLYQDIYNAQLQNMLSTGDMNRMLEQAAYDIAYNDWMNQQDYPRQTLNWLTGIIRGYPYTSQMQTNTMPQPNPYSQLMGAGLSSAALMNLMG